LKSVELFIGAGGLALGVAQAGFEPLAVVECNKHACQTIRLNQLTSNLALMNWPLWEVDVKQIDYASWKGKVALVTGGPPCQPFSLGGKHQAYQDQRDMFPEMVRAIRELKPQAFIIENVKGLLRESFATYYQYILYQLSYPEIVRRERETWPEHFARLEKQSLKKMSANLSYQVNWALVNAADYGVPQRRERVIIVGFQKELGISWTMPPATHSQESLWWEQWVTETYWERHKITVSQRPQCPTKLLPHTEKMRQQLFPPAAKPWKTVRDAITDLIVLDVSSQAEEKSEHWINPGARAYPGHTGSCWDEPAKTLKAGDHGVPGGENTLVMDDGCVRYFTIRECARLQTFPDNYQFSGSWTESMRQLGNAVPVSLAEVIAKSVYHSLKVISIDKSKC
jgi:DNA (cytosine-5)-methyltransferase 1